jgi:hypothetical protein
MSRQKEQNDLIAEWAKKALTLEGFETESGFCLRFVRQVVQAALGADAWKIPRGFDAAQALAFCAQNDWVLPVGASNVPGDLAFWVGRSHGKHGHVAIRVLGNEIAENSSYHVHGTDRDARGTRKLANIATSVRWVRLPVVKR